MAFRCVRRSLLALLDVPQRNDLYSMTLGGMALWLGGNMARRFVGL